MQAPQHSIRPSAIAGQWYPGSGPALRAAVERYMGAGVPVELPGQLFALIAPHAGYAYSGPTAGRAFAQIRNTAFSRIVLFGPLHRPIWGARLGPFMAPTEAAYHTPLGDVPVDHDFLEALGRHAPLTIVREDEEHSLEIELPFLQVALPRFAIVPIMFGEHVAERGVLRRCETLAAALAALWDDQTLVVVSTDLTHASDYEAVRRSDAVLVDLVERFDVDGLVAAFGQGTAQACGATGLVTALRLAQQLGAQRATVLEHTTSADVTGDKRPGAYTVGYLAALVHA